MTGTRPGDLFVDDNGWGTPTLWATTDNDDHPRALVHRHDLEPAAALVSPAVWDLLLDGLRYRNPTRELPPRVVDFAGRPLQTVSTVVEENGHPIGTECQLCGCIMSHDPGCGDRARGMLQAMLKAAR